MKQKTQSGSELPQMMLLLPSLPVTMRGKQGRAQQYAQGRIGLDGALGVQWASNPITHIGHIPLWGEIGLLAEKCHMKDNFSSFSSQKKESCYVFPLDIV